MNARTITVQAPVQIPKPPRPEGKYFFHVFGTDSGFVFRWVSLADCPIYVRAKTGQKARLSMSLTNRISELPAHGKVVLVFEELLACEDGVTTYNKWEPGEWFPYLNE